VYTHKHKLMAPKKSKTTKASLKKAGTMAATAAVRK
jgi:hypothetical protein